MSIIHKNNLNHSQIAKIVGVCRPYVHKILVENVPYYSERANLVRELAEADEQRVEEIKALNLKTVADERRERKARAEIMRKSGFSIEEIAASLGVCRATVFNYVGKQDKELTLSHLKTAVKIRAIKEESRKEYLEKQKERELKAKIEEHRKEAVRLTEIQARYAKQIKQLEQDLLTHENEIKGLTYELNVINMSKAGAAATAH